MGSRVVEHETDGSVPDPRQAQRRFAVAAKRYADAAVLQNEVCRRLMERLDVVKLVPRCVLDVGCGPGTGARELSRRYPKARIIALDYSEAMLRQARRNTSRFGRVRRVVGDSSALPLASDSVDLIFSNMMLPWCSDPVAVFREFQRVLRPEGVLMFTSLGPDTLKELRYAWAEVDDGHHVHAFEDMHNVGDALVRARLADPVMDMEFLTLTYDDVPALMRDIKCGGGSNVALGRARGLTGKHALARMQGAYEAYRDADGRLPATFEVVYGHAWGTAVPGSFQADDGSVVVPLSRLRRRQG